jgi:hypothetical protein
MRAGLICPAEIAAIIPAHLAGIAIFAVVLVFMLRQCFLRDINPPFQAGHFDISHPFILSD